MLFRKNIFVCLYLLKAPLIFLILSLGRCDLYGDPHYISFQGVPFDFLEECTYVLVEERSPRHHLTIAVDNFYCVPGLLGSCAKGIILKYQNNTATLDINPKLFAVQVESNIIFFVYIACHACLAICSMVSS